MSSTKPLASKNTRNKKIWQTRRLWLVVVFLLAAAGGAGWYFLMGPGRTSSKTTAQSDTQTYTSTVKRGDLEISASGSGKLVAYQSVDLSFSTSGTVTELNVKVGDMVKAGQVLASLGSSQTLEANLASAKLQVLTAQKALTDLQQQSSLALAQAYSDLVTAQDTYDTVLKKSQRVTTARCSQDVNTRYKLALERATLALNNIHAETAGSDAYIVAKKAYDTALANYNYCIAYTSDEKTSSQSTLDVAKTSLQQAQDKYDTLKAASGIDPNELAMDEANLKKAQAQLDQANDQLAGITLTSPIDGKVTYLATSAGAIVNTSKFITIADVSHSTIDISIDESDIDKLVIHSPVTVSFDALTDQTFTGKVTQVNPQITSSGQYRIAKGLVELDADAVKTVSALPLGVSATVKIVNKEAKNALLVPVVALKDLGDNTYGVMVKGSDGQLKLQIVTVGIQGSDYAEITSGLNEGDIVSTGTVNFIAAGSSTDANSIKNSQDAGGFPGMPPAP
jgi:HlyD family secretion protein